MSQRIECHCLGRPTRCGRCALIEAAQRRMAEKEAQLKLPPGAWPANLPRRLGS